MAGNKTQTASQGASPQRQAEPAAPVPEPLSPQFRPIHSTTPIPPPTIPTFHRQTFTHKQHPPQVEAIPQPPPPEPVDFSENVDVIALESAILLLQRQKQQAEEDIRQLQRIKQEAVKKPAEFVQDLASGKVGQGPQGAAPISSGANEDEDDSEDDDEDEDEDDDDEGSDAEMAGQDGGQASSSGLGPSPMKASGKGKAAAAPQPQQRPQPSWTNLPTPQDVVRMPAINWSKYAVVGESLDKLHSEQLTRPTLGMPATVGADGKAYEFKGEPNPDDGKKSVGIAAPYDPLHDKIKKPRK
ncbi:hypothetical protein J7T55_008543 [Diaporthe amygdali]|uniref:uncharacterized protein n=1 Tax=Phomopsis amygdali TaxID=1214568 RepID=UPI0022FE6794|nr:uncharacterized protein J7T55_008543 [Diaporthe amygdali]KAJ0121379.1 hypothetical protein J7T55_008543 [Diaporthe amygdali]